MKRVTFKNNKTGKETILLIRQMPHDRQLRVGSRKFGCVVVRIQEAA
jgi:hypothetical protein